MATIGNLDVVPVDRRVGGNGASAEAEAALRAAAPPQCEVVGTPVAPEAPRGAEGTPAWGV